MESGCVEEKGVVLVFCFVGVSVVFAFHTRL